MKHHSKAIPADLDAKINEKKHENAGNPVFLISSNVILDHGAPAGYLACYLENH